MKLSFPPRFHPPTPRIHRSGGSIWQDFPGVCLIGKLPDSGSRPAGPDGQWWIRRSTMCTERAVLGGYLGRGYPRYPPGPRRRLQVSERAFRGGSEAGVQLGGAPRFMISRVGREEARGPGAGATLLAVAHLLG